MQINKGLSLERVLSMNDLAAIPYYESVAAGFPSPAADYAESNLSLDGLVIKNHTATFFVKVEGDSMIKAGIYDGDLLIVDRSIPPISNKIVVAYADEGFTVKRLIISKNERAFLVPENSAYQPLEITGRDDVIIWGVVINSLRWH